MPTTAGVLTAYMYSNVYIFIYDKYGEVIFEGENADFTSDQPGYYCEVVSLKTKNYPDVLGIEIDD